MADFFWEELRRCLRMKSELLRLDALVIFKSCLLLSAMTLEISSCLVASRLKLNWSMLTSSGLIEGLCCRFVSEVC